MMCKLTLFITYLCCMQAYGSYATSTKDCMKKCLPDGETESYVACERGCRFFGAIASLHGQSAQGNTSKVCRDDCREAYKSVDEGSQCYIGCALHKKLLDEVAANTQKSTMEAGLVPMMTFREVATRCINGLRMVQTRVVAFFIKDDQIIQISTRPQVFVDVPAVMDHNHEGPSHKSSEELLSFRKNEIPDDSFLLGKDRPSLFAGTYRAQEDDDSKPSVVRVMHLRNIQHLLAMVGISLLLLCVLLYIVSRYRNALARNNKQSNLSQALSQEPLKLVLPEDLTKLSLMEEDEPSKQGFALPSAKV